MATLIYETTDSDFAESCVQALANADVSAFRTGGALPGGSDFTICIYIHDPSQYQEANEVLIKLGAVINSGPTLPSRTIIVLMVAVMLLFAVIVATWGQILKNSPSKLIVTPPLLSR